MKSARVTHISTATTSAMRGDASCGYAGLWTAASTPLTTALG